MQKVIRRIELEQSKGDTRQILRREWLATNGLGGYASGTISGSVTWRYHGLLIAAHPAPFGRMVMLNHMSESVCLPDGQKLQFCGEEPTQPEEQVSACHCIREFRLENQMPVWRYQVDGIILEKNIHLLYGQNTVHITFRLLSSEPARLDLRPSMHFRPHEQSVAEFMGEHYLLSIHGRHYEVSAGEDMPRLRMVLEGEETSFTHDGGSKREIYYIKEAERGYESRGQLWSPGYFTVNLRPQKEVTLIASTESWHTMLALNAAEALKFYHQRHHRLVSAAEPKAQQQPAAELVLAADQFIINPVGRVADAARAHAAGDEIRTVIAGYHWFTDWGRDTMISLEGLTLTTRRYTEAGWILRTFAHYVKDGLIPNMFPEGKNEGLYHTADASLWFFHAVNRYLECTGDRATLKLILPKLQEIADRHLKGTRFGIHVDPEDGLLAQGSPGYQLTWMDAKVEDWVVTPRRGKAVEINALWYNALMLMGRWMREEQGDKAALSYLEQAKRARESFNNRFWYAEGNYLYDLIEGEQGNDTACRPNQLLAISLPHPILEEQHWEPVLRVTRERLLTAVGLRSLSREHPDYKPKYFGDLRARDAAYHQGTVWAWLIGPFVDAWLKVYPKDKAGARKVLEGFLPHLDEACVGSISEIFDAEPPFTPRGCIAQAWSVAEVLRTWVKTAE
ncbi:MAG: glycogen debranching protein [Verrucomicrobiales bacterium]|nr:glycogen debranching protein [Verrucomicrobiales bacterium]